MAKLQGERRELSKRCTALQEEAAGVAGAQLASDALSPGGGVPHYHRQGSACCSAQGSSLLSKSLSLPLSSTFSSLL